MRIVLDAGILVRAHDGRQGLGRQLLLTLIEDKHTLLVSGPILVEVAKVLRYPRLRKTYALTEDDIYQYIAFLREVGEVVVFDPALPVPIRDVNDIAVAQTAIFGRAGLLCAVDGDFHDPVARRFLERFGVRVVTDIDLMQGLRDRAFEGRRDTP